MPHSISLIRFLILGLLMLIPAFLLQQPAIAGNILKRVSTALRSSRQQPLHITTTMTNRTPVYFLSHGGPNIMEDVQHPAYKKLQEIGQEITGKVKPKAIVVFSAHWQGFQDTIEVNTMESSPLIYDFYGFPVSITHQET